MTGLSTVFFDVVFNPQGTVDVGTYAFNLFYDDAELMWNSGLTTISAPSPLSSQMLGPLDGSTSGFIGNFNAASFGTDATLSSPFTLAHLAFDVASPVQDGSADVWFDTTMDTKFGFTVNGSGVLMGNMPINNNLPSIAVVPEPVSSALFIIGGATLGLRRFRKKRRIS